MLAYWHGLAKLRMHTDLSLDLLDSLTTELGHALRKFSNEICLAFPTKELKRELDARMRRQAKAASQRAPNSSHGGHNTHNSVGQERLGSHNGRQESDPNQDSASAHNLRGARRPKSFNLSTYKVHSLGDIAHNIRQYGTTDSYSTEGVSHSHLSRSMQPADDLRC